MKQHKQKNRSNNNSLTDDFFYAKFIFLVFFIALCISPQLSAQSFYKVIGDPVQNEGGVTICGSPDGNLFVGGFVADSGMVMKINPLGEILWKRTFAATAQGSNMVNSLSITPDGFLIGTGHSLTNIFSEMFYFKMDLNGNLLWCHREAHTQSLYATDIFSVSTTEYFLSVAYYYPNGSWVDPTILRIDGATGNILSPTTKYNLAPVPYLDDVYCSLILPGRSTYQIGRTYLDGADQSKMRPFLIKYDALQTPLWAKYYLYPANANARLYGLDTQQEGDSIACFYFGDRFGSSANFTMGIFKTDTNGVVSWAKDYNIVGSASEIFYQTVQVPGGYVIYGFTAGLSDLFLLSIDLNGVVQWAKSFGSPAFSERSTNQGKGVCNFLGSIWFVGTESGASSNLILGRTDYAGNIACQPGTNLTVVTTPFVPTVTNLTITPAADPVPLTIVPVQPSPDLEDCPFSVDLGPDTATCSSVLLDAGTGAGWQYLWSDNSTGSTLNTTGPGIYWVQVTLNCCTKSDTIEVIGSTFTIDLGPDTTLCAGTMLLDAQNPGATYLWSDGSTGQTLNAGTGQWWVQVTLEGCIASDTILISPAPPEFVSLGPDTTGCTGIIMTLSAGMQGTFLWSTNETSATIEITNPGTYWIDVIDQCGNASSDTIVISFNVTPQPNLGPDSIICPLDQIQLDAGIAPATYLWSDNQTTQSISAGVSTMWVAVTQNGCTGRDTIVISAIQLPLVSITPVNPQCVSGNSFNFQTENLTDSNATFLWQFLPDGFPATSVDSAPSGINFPTTGTKMIIVTTTQLGCIIQSDTIFVNVTPTPNPSWDYTSSGPCFNNNSFNFFPTANNNGATYFWTFQNGAPSNSALSNPTASFLQPGINQVTLVVTLNGCSDSLTKTINLISNPVADAGLAASFCDGSGGAQLLGSGTGGSTPYYFTWWCDSSNTWCGLDSVFDNDPIANPDVTTMYYFQITDFNGCVSNIDSTEVTVLPLPIVDAGIDQYICADSAPGAFLVPTINNAPGPYTFSWSPATGLNDPTLQSPFARPDTTTIYTLQVISSNGCSSLTTTVDSLSSVTVVVQPLPVADAGPDIHICLSDSVMLQGIASGAGPAYSYQWSPSVGMNDNTLTNPTVSPSATTDFVFVVWSNACPSQGDTVTVNVHTLPTVDAGPDREHCVNDSVLLDAQAGGDTTSSFYTFVWTPSHGLSNDSIEDPMASTTGTSFYWVQATSEWGCESALDSALLTLLPSPIAEAGDNVTFCSNQTVQLNGSYTWASQDTGGISDVIISWDPNQFISDPDTSAPQVNPPSTQYYYFSTQYHSCISVDSVLVTVIPSPEATAWADTVNFCAGDTIGLFGSGGLGGAQFWWTGTDGTSFSGDSLWVSPNDTVIYTLVVQEGPCNDTTAIALNPIPDPEVAFLQSLTEGCVPFDVSFLSLSSNTQLLTWDFGDGAISNESNPIHTFTEPGIFWVTLEGANTGNCKSESEGVYIDVADTAHPEFFSDPEWPAILYLPFADVQFTDASTNSASQHWSFGDGIFSDEKNPEHRFMEEGTYYVTLYGQNDRGCTGSKTHGPYIVMPPDLFIPNVFSPNEDGINDVFFVKYIGNQPFQLSIFDRWGNLLDESQDKYRGWNGTSRGEIVPDGVYFYKCVIGGKEYTGNVTMVR